MTAGAHKWHWYHISLSKGVIRIRLHAVEASSVGLNLSICGGEQEAPWKIKKKTSSLKVISQGRQNMAKSSDSNESVAIPSKGPKVVDV